MQLDLALDLDRNSEGQLGHSYCASRVRAALRTARVDDQVREAVDDGGLAIEARSGIDHAEDPRPRCDAVQRAELALQAAQDRESGEPCGGVRLLERHFAADLSKR